MAANERIATPVAAQAKRRREQHLEALRAEAARQIEYASRLATLDRAGDDGT